MAETTGTGAGGTRTAHTTSRVPIILGAVAGALAIAGSMITWVTVERGKLTTQLRGTEFGVGVLTFACGVVIVIAIAAWALGSDSRLRAAMAAIVLAAGAVVTIAIGSSMATRALFDQAAPADAKQKHGRHHQQKGGGQDTNATPTASATALGLAYRPDVTGGTTPLPGMAHQRSFAELGDAAAGGGNRHARKKAITSTLQPGVFIALAGGVLAMVAGLWGLLAGRAAAPASGGSGDTATADPPGGPRTEPPEAPGAPRAPGAPSEPSTEPIDRSEARAGGPADGVP